MNLFEKFHSEHRGRGLRATSFIRKGTLLLTELPFAHVVSEKVERRVCSNCMKSATLKNCSGCKRRFYCSQKCQKAMWPLHKHECSALKHLQQSEGATDFLMLLYQVLIKLNSKTDWKKEGYLQSVSDLNSHYDKENVSDEEKLEMEQIFVKLKILSKEGGVSSDLLNSYHDVCHLMSKLRCNVFGIQDEEFVDTDGIGLYLNCSLFNHDCEPNCAQIFQASKVHIRALRDVQAGEELTITYCSLPACSASRQKYLQSYHFVCTCDACKYKKYDNEMLSDQNGMEIEEEQFKDLNSRYEKLVELNEKGENDNIITKCKDLIAEDNFADGNIIKLKILQLMGRTSINLGNFEDALEYHNQYLPYYSKYIPFHPMIGLIHATVGKMLAFQNNSEDAMRHIKEALKRLCLSHGGNSPVIAECERILQECQMYLQQERMSTE